MGNKDNITSLNVANNTVLINTDNNNVLSYYMTNITNEKKLHTVIKAVEKMVRTSKKYTAYIRYLKETVGLTTCAVLPNMGGDETNVAVEMHHYPFTLYDIVKIVIINNMINKNKFSTYTIAAEVIGLHINNLVGIVPLTTTIHQLYDVDDFNISKDMFFGDIMSLISMYRPAITKDMVAKFNKLISKVENFSIITHKELK